MTAQRKAAQPVSRTRENAARGREAGKRAAQAVATTTAGSNAAKDAAGATKDAAPREEGKDVQRADRLRRIQERVAVARPAPERPAQDAYEDEPENRRGRDLMFDEDVVEQRRYRSPDEAAESE